MERDPASVRTKSRFVTLPRRPRRSISKLILPHSSGFIRSLSLTARKQRHSDFTSKIFREKGAAFLKGNLPTNFISPLCTLFSNFILSHVNPENEFCTGQRSPKTKSPKKMHRPAPQKIAATCFQAILTVYSRARLKRHPTPNSWIVIRLS
jgi:hypothetical protein